MKSKFFRYFLDTRLILVFLFLFTFLRSFIFAHFGITMLTDDNQDFTAATRILHGATIYRNYQAFLPPISDYFLALILYINHNSYLWSIYIYVFIVCFLPPLFFLLVKKVSSSLLAFIFAFGITFSYIRFDLLFFYTFFIGSYLLTIKYFESKKIRFAFFSGFMLMLGSLFRLDLAFFTFCGLFTIFFINFLKKKKEKKNLKAFFLLISTPLLVNLSVLVWLLNVKALSYWIDSIKTGMIAKEHWSINFFSPSLLFPEKISLQTLYNSWNGWIYIVWGLVTLAFIFQIGKEVRKKGFSFRNVLLFAFLVNISISLVYTRVQFDLPHFVKGAIIFFALLASCIAYSKNKIVRVVASLSFLSFFLVQIALNLWIANFSNSSMTLSSRGANIFVNERYIQDTTLPSKDMILTAVSFLSKAKPNEKVFVAPYMSMLYFLSDRQNPTIYDNLLHGADLPGYGERYIIVALKKNNVRFVVYDRESNPKETSGLYKMKDYYPLLDDYLMKNFRTDRKIGGWLYMERKG